MKFKLFNLPEPPMSIQNNPIISASGYKYKGVLYATHEAAKTAAIKDILEAKCTRQSSEFHYGGWVYSLALDDVAANYDAIQREVSKII